MRRFLAAVAIFLIVTLVFCGAMPNNLVRYDDYEYIVMNPHIKDGLNAGSVRWSLLSAGYAANWHPLAWMSHAADISLAKALGIDPYEPENKTDTFIKDSGAFPKLAHIHNVLLHAANAVLLFVLCALCLAPRASPDGRACRSATAAQSTSHQAQGTLLLLAGLVLLWALHPLRVEVVAWVSERKELLSVFFMLLTLICYVVPRVSCHVPCAENATDGNGGRVGCPQPTAAQSTKHPALFFAVSLFFYVLALASKPVAVSLPAVLFAFDWILRRESFKRSFLRALPFAVLALAVCCLTVVSQDEAMHGAGEWTLLNRILAPVEAPVIYLAQTFWPVNLTIDYAVPDWSSWPIFAAGVVLLLALALAGVGYLVLRLKNRVPVWLSLVAFAIAWVYVGLLPMLGIVKVGYEPHNDRYTYWIGCGVIVVLTLALRYAHCTLHPAQGTRHKALRTLYTALPIVLAILSLMTFRLTRTWKDSETLFMRAVLYNYDVAYGQMLAEVIAVRHPEHQPLAVDIMREILYRRQTPFARAALAYQLAAYAPGVSHQRFDGTKTDPFAEARMLARLSLKDHPADRTAEFACAALAFADFREKKYESALTWMNRAVECGYEPKSHNVDMDLWKEKAHVSK